MSSPDQPVFAVDNLKGIGWIVISVVASSAMTIAVRGSSMAVDSRMVVLLRAGLTLAALAIAILLVARLRRKLRFSRPWLHISRGAMIGFSTHLGFYAIANIPLATVTVLFFTAPIFATILSAIYQKEAVGPRRIAAIAAGFLGALVIIQPGADVLELAMLTALASSVLFAAALIQSRGIAEADGSFSALVSSVVMTVVISIPLAAPVLSLPSGWVAWGFVFLLVVTGAIRNIADIEAYRFGEASVVAPFTYMRLVFIGIGGYLFFDEIPEWATLIGAVIIIGAALYIARREAQLRKAAKLPAEP